MTPALPVVATTSAIDPDGSNAAKAVAQAGAAPDTEFAVDLAKGAHANFQDMVKVADGKATSLVAMQALILAITGSGLAEEVGRAWTAGGRSGWALMVTSGAMVLVTGWSILFSIAVLLPRFPRHLLPPSGARGLMWITELETAFKKGGSPDGYLRELQATDRDRLLADLAFENIKIAWILGRKFAWLKRAVWTLIAAVLFWIAVLTSAAVFAAVHDQAFM